MTEIREENYYVLKFVNGVLFFFVFFIDVIIE